MEKKRKVAVIGIGRFGSSMVETMVDLGFEVMAIDGNEEIVEKHSNICPLVVQADSTDQDALNKLGITHFDIVVVAIGRNTNANLLTSLLLVEMKVSHIIAKAESTLQGRMLEKIGVHQVIFPEKDMAARVAHTIFSENIIELVVLAKDMSLVEVKAPGFYLDKNLTDLTVPNQHQVSVVAVKRHEEILVPPFSGTKIHKDDIIIVIGPLKGIEKMNLLE